ncbi:hypothetical protein N7447_005931 [Penicillium robsamsonii]|uniref:uncharacterized protein n=1 Tax=Penicillium robsamsonii TaxID=1792511 RepID=UPI0025471018|nr:uncharacterized protein N7447_005931 [Penicillium robsamsonii]KAJ5823591.1 hypothetical protein N7447_005931 [Penicillium robsamsonii]
MALQRAGRARRAGTSFSQGLDAYTFGEEVAGCCAAFFTGFLLPVEPVTSMVGGMVDGDPILGEGI